MTDPKSRVQLALELAALAAHDDDAIALARAIMVGGGVGSLALALANVLLHLVDERETQLHPIAMAFPSTPLEKRVAGILYGGRCSECGNLPEDGHSLTCSKTHHVTDPTAHPAPTSPPGDDNLAADHWWRACRSAERERDILQVQLTHEGATAAEWASRYADAEMRAKTWKAEFEREAKAAREGRVLVSRLEGQLRAAVEDCEYAVNGRGAALAELARLKEENARLEALGKDLRCKWVTLDEHGLALRENTRLSGELAGLSGITVTLREVNKDYAELECWLAAEKAAHEVTRRELEAQVLKERDAGVACYEEMVRECHKRDAVVEAARDVANRSSSPDGRVPSYEMQPLVDALSALDRTEGEQAATPPESPVPAEAPREIRVGSKWLCSANDRRVIVTEIGDPRLDYESQDGGTRMCGTCTQDRFRADHQWLSDPEPPAERPVAGEGKL